MINEIILSTFLVVSCPIKDQIVRNNPKLETLYVDYLSSTIAKIAKKYNIPTTLYTAILMQESAYNLSAKNCKGDRCTDFGIGQIHIGSVKRYKLNKNRLLTDLEYSLEASARILAEFKRIHKGKKRWWTNYNGGNKLTKAKYFSNVSRFK